MVNFTSPDGLHACYLGSETPPGALICRNGKIPAVLWIVGEGDRSAVVLSETAAARPWQTFPLAAPGNWFGYHIGAVELEVDRDSAVVQENGLRNLGDIYVTAGGLYIVTSGDGYAQQQNLKIGPATSYHHRGLLRFPSWRLIQSRPAGAMEVIFSR